MHSPGHAHDRACAAAGRAAAPGARQVSAAAASCLARALLALLALALMVLVGPALRRRDAAGVGGSSEPRAVNPLKGLLLQPDGKSAGWLQHQQRDAVREPPQQQQGDGGALSNDDAEGADASSSSGAAQDGAAGGDSSSGSGSSSRSSGRSLRGAAHSRTVVVPDVHGDLDQAIRALRLAGVIDAQGSWTGGDTLLVQLGDVLDRGEHSLLLLDLLDRLQLQAAAAGGRVELLLGNHELMNVYLDFRYVSRTELATLADLGRAPTWDDHLAAAATAAAGRRQTMGHEHGGGAAGAHDGPTGQSGTGGSSAADDDIGSSGRITREGADRELLRMYPDHERMMEPGRNSDSSNGNGAGIGEGSGSSSVTHARSLLAAAGAAAASYGIASGGGSGGGHGGGAARRGGLRKLLVHSRHGVPRETLERGLEVWQQALAPTARLGRLIRARPLALRANATAAPGCSMALIHAGLFGWMLDGVEALAGSKELEPDLYFAAWNAAAAEALAGCEGSHCGTAAAAGGGDSGATGQAKLAGALLGGHGAVWSRHYVKTPAQKVCAEVAAVCARLGVERIVVGHTVQAEGRVAHRCGGRLLMADVGLNREIQGGMAVLECAAAGGGLRALYGDGTAEEMRLG